MTNTGPPHATGGHHAPTPTPGEPAPHPIPQARQATGPAPGAAPGEEGLSVPRPAAARNSIAPLTGPFLTMGRPVSRDSAGAGIGVSRNGAASGGQAQATWA
jgi:hypothetical protein